MYENKELIEGINEEDSNLDIGDMGAIFGDMGEVAVTEGFESEKPRDMDEEDFYGSEPSTGGLDDMFGSYSPYAEKKYIPRYARSQERLEGVEYADTSVKPLEHVIIHGKSYTDMTPLFLETPTDILYSTDINKLKK